MYDSEDLEIKNYIFVDKVLEVIDSEAPLKKDQYRKNFRKWVSPDIKLLMESRDQLRNQAAASGRVEDWLSFKTARNKVVKELRSSKNKFFEKLYISAENETSSKNLYKLTKELQDTNSGNSPQIFLKDGKPLRKPALMANFQLEHYINKVKSIMEHLPRPIGNPYRVLDAALARWDDTDNILEFKFRDVTLAETSKYISTLSDSTDRIDSIAIKSAAAQLIRPLQHIIKLSLNKSQFCRKWKFSKLTPTLKSRDLNRMLPSSYRPMAVLSTVSKLAERAAQTQLSEFFEKYKLLNPSNHAYRKNLSTSTTLTEIMDELHEGIEKKKINQIMTLDQTAVFDCVSFDILIGKLERYKVGPEA